MTKQQQMKSILQPLEENPSQTQIYLPIVTDANPQNKLKSRVSRQAEKKQKPNSDKRSDLKKKVLSIVVTMIQLVPWT